MRRFLLIPALFLAASTVPAQGVKAASKPAGKRTVRAAATPASATASPPER